jgi:hypothetical protein
VTSWREILLRISVAVLWQCFEGCEEAKRLSICLDFGSRRARCRCRCHLMIWVMELIWIVRPYCTVVAGRASQRLQGQLLSQRAELNGCCWTCWAMICVCCLCLGVGHCVLLRAIYVTPWQPNGKEAPKNGGTSAPGERRASFSCRLYCSSIKLSKNLQQSSSETLSESSDCVLEPPQNVSLVSELFMWFAR